MVQCVNVLQSRDLLGPVQVDRTRERDININVVMVLIGVKVFLTMMIFATFCCKLVKS